MASIKALKANAIAQQAKWAIENHHTHFTPILNMPMFHVGFSGAVFDWAMMINAIEREGWTLEHWAVGLDREGRPQAMPVFVVTG